jgi:hypothetical protein
MLEAGMKTPAIALKLRRTPFPSRPEAVRRLVELGLKAKK